MRAVPIRGADGKIVDFVDPRALEEAQEVTPPPQETEMTEAGEEPPPRRAQALRPTERKPLADLLGTSTTTSQTNRGFTTGMVAGLLGALIVAALIVFSRTPMSTSTRALVDAPTSVQSTASAPATAPASVQSTASSVAIVAPTLGRALVAYAAPDGAVVGAISADRAISLTGMFGSEWIQIETTDSGLVWVKQADLPNAALDPVALASLPDLAPPPTATALPAPTVAPVVQSVAPVSPASARISPASAPATNVSAPAQRCTPDQVVAIVERGVTQVASCISLTDAQSSLPNSTVVAASADEAQTFYDQAAVQATALAKP